MMSMCTLRSLAVLSALLILEAPRCSMALPKSWMKGVHPKEESAPEIDHSAAAAAAQDLMDQLDTSHGSDEVEESMQNLETPALKTREYNPVDPPYGKEPTYGQDPKPYRPDPEPYNPNPEPYNPDPKPYGQDPTYDKDPHCRTYYDYVYDKKCKDYKDKVCYTTYTEYC